MVATAPATGRQTVERRRFQEGAQRWGPTSIGITRAGRRRARRAPRCGSTRAGGSYAFHHEEAIRCFERAVEHDPGFALAHWGIAYAIGPNYNKQWEAFDPVDLAASLEKACDEVAAARACADRAAPVERALVQALGSRYQANDPSADLVAWNADYAEVMRDVYRAHPDDLDVAALFADALMNLTPWELWDRYTGQPPEGAATSRPRGAERRARATGGTRHPGSCTLRALMECRLPERRPVAESALARPEPAPRAHADAHRRAVRRLQSTLEWKLRAIRSREDVAREAGSGFLRALTRADPLAIYGAIFSAGSESRWAAPRLEGLAAEELLRLAASMARLPRGVSSPGGLRRPFASGCGRTSSRVPCRRPRIY